MLRKISIFAAGLAAAGLMVFAVSLLFRGETVDSAIGRYDDGDYSGSLRALNKLSLAADYEKGEQIYYYRVRAVNALAEQLESKYEDELRAAAIDSGNAGTREKETGWLLKKLAGINAEIDGDLALLADKRRSRIVPRGKFYDEFVSRYKGSRYIEDLDFEELKKVERTEPDKLLNAVSNFYTKYPQTFYISSIVKMIFKGMQDGVLSAKGREELLKSLIIEYGKKYPTSAEVQRIYVCGGNDVNLRNSAGTEGGIVGKVKKGEILIQLEKSMDTSQVGDVRDYWYRMANLNGLTGWIFGKFIAPLDVKPYMTVSRDQTWSIEDYFAEWEDSYTPKGWMHVPGGERSSISFSVHGDARILKLNSQKGRSAGLFRRFDSGASFAMCVRARFIAGDSIIAAAYVMKNGSVYYLSLKDEEIDLSGRKIPLRTADWHEYTLEIRNSTEARLSVDGEVLLNRVPPVPAGFLKERGAYCMYSGENEASLGEVEYVKLRN
jgi:hypothetical protein